MTLVFEAGGLSPSQKSVLLALADHGNEEGQSIYPSTERLTKKTGLSERTVQRAIDDLCSSGVVVIISGARQHAPNHYEINVPMLAEIRDPWFDEQESKKAKRYQKARGDTVTPVKVSGVPNVYARGDTVTPESFNHHIINHHIAPENTSGACVSGTDPLGWFEETAPVEARAPEDFKWLRHEYKPLAFAFLEAAGMQHSPLEKERSLWRKVLIEWKKLGLTPDVISGTVEYMRKEGLTIKSPTSVTGTARDRMGAVPDAPTIPKLTAAVLEGLNGNGHNS